MGHPHNDAAIVRFLPVELVPEDVPPDQVLTDLDLEEADVVLDLVWEELGCKTPVGKEREGLLGDSCVGVDDLLHNVRTVQSATEWRLSTFQRGHGPHRLSRKLEWVSS